MMDKKERLEQAQGGISIVINQLTALEGEGIDVARELKQARDLDWSIGCIADMEEENS